MTFTHPILLFLAEDALLNQPPGVPVHGGRENNLRRDRRTSKLFEEACGPKKEIFCSEVSKRQGIFLFLLDLVDDFLDYSLILRLGGTRDRPFLFVPTLSVSFPGTSRVACVLFRPLLGRGRRGQRERRASTLRIRGPDTPRESSSQTGPASIRRG